MASSKQVFRDYANVYKHPLHKGGQPPDNGDMEARFAKIETRLDQVDDRLTRVEVKLEHIDKEVSNFKWWVIAQIAAGLLAVLGTGIAIQQMTVASFQGAAQVAKDAAPAAQSSPQPIVITIPQSQPAPAPAKP